MRVRAFRRRWTVFAAVAMTGALALSGCGGDDGGDSKNDSSEVEVFSWWTGPGEADGLAAMQADFEKKNPGTKFVNAAIAGRDGFTLNVENAGHAFDNHESEMFYDESAAKAVWAKTMAFLGTHLPTS